MRKSAGEAGHCACNIVWRRATLRDWDAAGEFKGSGQSAGDGVLT